MIKAVSFDAHGTLILPEPSPGTIYARQARTHGIDEDPTELDARFPRAFAEVRAGWPVPYGADEDDARRFWSEVIAATFTGPVPGALVGELFAAFGRRECWRILPGAEASIAAVVAAGLPALVCSNFDLRLPALLDDLGLGPFAAVVVSSQVGRPKPSPDCFVRALEICGCAAGELLHVGDNPREDEPACRAAGVRYLAVDRRRGPDPSRLAAALGVGGNSGGG